MKFSLHLPVTEINPPGEFQTVAAVQRAAQALERAGADACWVTDHPAPDVDWLIPNGHDAVDPFTALAVAAGATTRLRLHTNVLILPYRNPFVTAKAAATLDVLSGGRLILGVGGGYQKGEFEALGVDFHKRGALTDEALETIRMAWSGETVRKQGMGFEAKGNLPRPIPSPQPPIWVGGGSMKAVERAARWGDGWQPFYSKGVARIDEGLQKPVNSLDDLRDKILRLHEARAAEGRTGAFDICINPFEPLGSDSDEDVERFCEHVAQLAEVGITWIFAGVAHPSLAGFEENAARFGEQVIARCKSRIGGTG
jgi:probable F420-dependent oxidoreductase